MSKRRALVAMSGGVDSTVAACRTLEAGYEAVGVTMQLCPRGADQPNRDAADARAVAEVLGMGHTTLACTEAFSSEVVEPFVRAYEDGQTPNPCIRCNRRLKFGYLLAYAEQEGFDTLVTGHYARVCYDEASGEYRLKKARALAKDQSYVLYFLSQEQLAHVYFPLGEFASKEEVREAAAAYGFVSANRKDSQDICFIPEGDYAAFITAHTGKTYAEGDFLDLDGEVIGRHRGLIHYTVGQRKGLGVTFGAPMYVKAKCAQDNTVTLSGDAALYESVCLLREVSYISSVAPTAPFRAAVKTRYSAREVEATVYPCGDGAQVVFDSPVRALTPGQAAVFYDGDTVLGGGVIACGETA